MHGTAVNVAKRAQMLVLAARGLSNQQIALELGANEQRYFAPLSRSGDYRAHVRHKGRPFVRSQFARNGAGRFERFYRLYGF